LAAVKPERLGGVGNSVHLDREISVRVGDRMELSPEDGLIVCSEERMANAVKAGLDDTVVLLLEMERDGISDDGVHKLWVELENGVGVVKPSYVNIVVCSGGKKSNRRKD
jgi:hypothetical protein